MRPPCRLPDLESGREDVTQSSDHEDRAHGYEANWSGNTRLSARDQVPEPPALRAHLTVARHLDVLG